jgi:hypothetical protein
LQLALKVRLAWLISPFGYATDIKGPRLSVHQTTYARIVYRNRHAHATT